MEHSAVEPDSACSTTLRCAEGSVLGEGALLCVLYMCCGPVVSGASRVAAVTCRRGSDGMPLQPLPWDLETLDEAFCLLYTVITPPREPRYANTE